MDNLVPIGRFAQVARLSVKALRHYDELGLLTPALVSAETGYRYYSLGQALDAERIRLLRALDVPLDEIAALLREREPAVVQARLSSHRERIESRIAEDRRRLETLGRLLAGAHPLAGAKVELRPLASQQVLSLCRRTALEAIGQAAAEAFAALFGYLQRLGVAPSGAPLSVYHGPPADDGTLEIEWCVPVPRALAGQGTLQGCELPAATAACLLHPGPYEEVGPSYGALASWLQAHGHVEAGPPREVYLVGPGQSADPDAFRTEIQWPVH